MECKFTRQRWRKQRRHRLQTYRHNKNNKERVALNADSAWQKNHNPESL